MRCLKVLPLWILSANAAGPLQGRDNSNVLARAAGASCSSVNSVITALGVGPYATYVCGAAGFRPTATITTTKTVKSTNTVNSLVTQTSGTVVVTAAPVVITSVTTSTQLSAITTTVTAALQTVSIVQSVGFDCSTSTVAQATPLLVSNMKVVALAQAQKQGAALAGVCSCLALPPIITTVTTTTTVGVTKTSIITTNNPVVTTVTPTSTTISTAITTSINTVTSTVNGATTTTTIAPTSTPAQCSSNIPGCGSHIGTTSSGSQFVELTLSPNLSKATQYSLLNGALRVIYNDALISVPDGVNGGLASLAKPTPAGSFIVRCITTAGYNPMTCYNSQGNAFQAYVDSTGLLGFGSAAPAGTTAITLEWEGFGGQSC